MKRKKAIKFLIKHLTLSFVTYYVLLLILDIVSKGAISRNFKISLLIIAGLILASVLAFLDKKKSGMPNQQKNARKNTFTIFNNKNKLFLALPVCLALILFLALAPHSLITAAVISLSTLALFYMNFIFFKNV